MNAVGAFVERFGPFLSGIGCFMALSWCKAEILMLVENKTLVMNNLYTAIFDWSAIQTGCLFAIYGFVAGKSDGFIGAIRHTITMQQYNSYLKRAIVIGFVLTVVSIPLIVTNFNLDAAPPIWYSVVAAWFSLFVWAFFAFARVAFVFGILVRTRDNPSRPAG